MRLLFGLVAPLLMAVSAHAYNSPLFYQGNGIAAFPGSILSVKIPTYTSGAAAFGPSGAITSTALSNGQLLIGATGGTPLAANLTAGVGITISNSGGGITINASGSPIPGVDVYTSNQTLTAANQFVIWNSTTQGGVFTLPDCTSLGKKAFHIKNYTNFPITITASGSDTIDGDTSLNIFGLGDYTVTCAGGTIYYVFDQ